MKSFLVVALLFGQLAAIVHAVPQEHALRLPRSATAPFFRQTDADPPPVRIDLLPRSELWTSPYRLDGRSVRADALAAELLRERQARKDAGRVSALHLVVRADRLAATGDLLALYRACAGPELAIWRISLAIAAREGDPRQAERILPLHIPIDAGLTIGTPDGGVESIFATNEETWRSAMSALPRGTAIEYLFENDGLAPDRFAAAVLGYKGLDAAGAIRLELPGKLLVGDLVLVVDLLRASGFRTGGARGAAIEVLLADTAGIAIAARDELRIRASRAAAISAGVAVEPEEEVVEEEVRDEEIVEDEVVEDVVIEESPGAGPARRESTPVDRGLAWLAAQQSADGRWDSDGFMANGDPALGPLADGPGAANHDVAATGLALLAFFGAGETQRAGPHKQTVARGLKWLRDQQDREGCFGDRRAGNFSYDHAIGTLAMTEAYGLTSSPLFKTNARRGLDFALACQNPYKAWRYGKADGQNDTSVTGWMVMALKSGQAAGFEIDPSRFEWALNWIEEMTDPETGRTGYIRRGERPVRDTGKHETYPADQSESLTALGILGRVFCGQDPAKNADIKRGAALLAARPPRWDEKAGTIDMYYWYFGTLALYQVGGEAWRTWNEALPAAIVEHQRSDGNFAGSWDPKGPWGEAGGRVYATALMTLALETHHRYGRVFGTRK